MNGSLHWWAYKKIVCGYLISLPYMSTIKACKHALFVPFFLYSAINFYFVSIKLKIFSLFYGTFFFMIIIVRVCLFLLFKMYVSIYVCGLLMCIYFCLNCDISVAPRLCIGLRMNSPNWKENLRLLFRYGGE